MGSAAVGSGKSRVALSAGEWPRCQAGEWTHRLLPRGEQFRRVTLQSPSMTIPGKGGRPRKWRSDADRIRAYRARQRGEAEPVVLAQALDHGDELARTWDTVRQLGAQLDQARTIEQQLRHEVSGARRELDRQQRQFGWIERANERARVELDETRRERDALTDQLAALRARVRVLETATSPRNEPLRPSPVRADVISPSPLSRAQRRQLEREQQRRQRDR